MSWPSPRVWWLMRCDWGDSWELVNEGSEPTGRALTCPEDRHDAVTVERLEPADLVRIVLVPAGRVRGSASTVDAGQGRWFLEVFSVDGAQSLRSDAALPWDEAVEKASRFRDLSWEAAAQRWRRTGMR